MALRYTMLASGSSGNASLVEADGFGVLIDVGLGPRQMASRLASVGLSWASVHAVLLTHTHSDHWKDRTFAHLRTRGIPLHCHPDHHAALRTYAPSFAPLAEANLVRPFEAGQDFALASGLMCRPVLLRHDGGATFGFRLQGARDVFGQTPALAYVADLGCWDDALADHLAEVDLLAVEFNHDVALEYASGRGEALIARVLGDEGHLSNAQAAELLRAVLERSSPGRLKHLVQLHLSRDCNRPALAREAARAVLAQLDAVAEVHTATQDAAGKTLHLNAVPARRRPVRRTRKVQAHTPPSVVQRWLPGLEAPG
jgi:phosphoribosyl 1,2-cyclic phosphodiesterase